MDKLRLVNMASDLILKQAFSDVTTSIGTYNYDDGGMGLFFTHYDDRYLKGNKTMYIFNFYSEEKSISRLDEMREVMAGERLITDEWKSGSDIQSH